MALPFACPSPAPFDPFLTRTRGAEVARDPATIARALDLVRGREVVVATGDGVVTVARAVAPRGLLFDAGPPVAAGDVVAVTDQRGDEYLGFRAVVGAVTTTPEGPVAHVFEPQAVLFYPGRRQPRLEGALGADVVLETTEGLLAARATDVSCGGVGVVLATDAGLAVGVLLAVHFHFPEGAVELPARVRSLVVREADVRVGLQFVGWSDALAFRVRLALDGGGRRAFGEAFH